MSYGGVSSLSGGGVGGIKFEFWCGVIAHVGPSIAAGHYISYFASNGKWYEANDSLVTEIDWEIVRKLQAYLFFYQQLQ